MPETLAEIWQVYKSQGNYMNKYILSILFIILTPFSFIVFAVEKEFILTNETHTLSLLNNEKIGFFNIKNNSIHYGKIITFDINIHAIFQGEINNDFTVKFENKSITFKKGTFVKFIIGAVKNILPKAMSMSLPYDFKYKSVLIKSGHIITFNLNGNLLSYEEELKSDLKIDNISFPVGSIIEHNLLFNAITITLKNDLIINNIVFNKNTKFMFNADGEIENIFSTLKNDLEIENHIFKKNTEVSLDINGKIKEIFLPENVKIKNIDFIGLSNLTLHPNRKIKSGVIGKKKIEVKGKTYIIDDEINFDINGNIIKE